MSTASLRVRSWPICLASVGEIRDRAQYDDRQGAWSRCADIDPAERGRVDRIGIPQRKKTGSPTAALGQNRSFGDVGSMSGLPESGQGWAIYEYTQPDRLPSLPTRPPLRTNRPECHARNYL
jgi:hypothetical protein